MIFLVFPILISTSFGQSKKTIGQINELYYNPKKDKVEETERESRQQREQQNYSQGREIVIPDNLKDVEITDYYPGMFSDILQQSSAANNYNTLPARYAGKEDLTAIYLPSWYVNSYMNYYAFMPSWGFSLMFYNPIFRFGFNGFYDPWYNPWYNPWNYWGSTWHNPWYNPWHNPWNDHWYNPWHGGWGRPSPWHRSTYSGERGFVKVQDRYQRSQQGRVVVNGNNANGNRFINVNNNSSGNGNRFVNNNNNNNVNRPINNNRNNSNNNNNSNMNNIIRNNGRNNNTNINVNTNRGNNSTGTTYTNPVRRR